MSDSAKSIHAQIQGDVVGQLAVGEHIMQVSVHGGVVNIAAPGEEIEPRERSGPVLLRPRPVSGWLDRQFELESAINGLRSSLPIEVSGEPGVGRTAFLRRLAHMPDLAAPHGVVYLNASGKLAGDLLQSIFEALYECRTSFKPTPTQLHLYLRDRRALVLVDDLELTRDGVELLLDAVPESSVVIANRQRTLWTEAQSIELKGLPEAESVVLLERELGRPVSDEERLAVRGLAAALGGHPIRLLQAGAAARQAHASLLDVLSHVKSQGPSALTTEIVRSLGDEDRKVLGALTALGMALPANAVAAIAQLADPGPALRRLADRGLVDERKGHYAVVAGVAVPQELVPDREESRARAIAFYAEWASSLAARPGEVAPEAENLLQLQKDADAKGQSKNVLRIGTALSVVLSLSGRWEAWAAVLDRNLAAARALGDRGAEALALHDSGTRALCLDDPVNARHLLRQAIDIRTNLGDRVGAAVSRHNADLLDPPPPADASSETQRAPEDGFDYDTIRVGDRASVPVVPVKQGSSWGATALVLMLGLAGVGGAGWWFTRDAAPQVATGVTPGDQTDVAEPPPPGRIVQRPPLARTTRPEPTPTTPEPTPAPGPELPTPPGPEPSPAPPPSPVTPPPAVPPPTVPPTPPATVVVADIPGAVNFGERTVRTPGDRRSVVIRSRGSKPLSVGNIRIVGEHSGDFRILANGCVGAPLADGANCTIDLGFTPSVVGRRTAQLEIADNSVQGSHVVSLAGDATEVQAPIAGLSPQRLEFQGQVGAKPGRPVPMRVINKGNAPLAIEKVFIEGTHARDFTIAKDTCEGTKLAPQADCTVDVMFGPTTEGSRVGRLTIVHNAGNADRSVDLVGRAEAQPSVAKVSPGRLDFKEQSLEKASGWQEVTIVNAGGGLLQVRSATIAGVNQGDFKVVENRCGAGLTSGASCVVMLQFAPGDVGARSGMLIVTADDGTRREVPMSGFGVGRGRIAVIPGAVDFGTLDLKTRKVQRVTVENTGTAPLAVSVLQLEPKDLQDFNLIDREGCVKATLDPGKQCTVDVQFAPTVPDGRKTVLVVADTTGAKVVVPVSGAGRVPPSPLVGELLIKPGRLEFGEQPISRLAKSYTRVLTLMNVGKADVQIDDVRMEKFERPGEFDIQGKPCVGVISPGKECTVTVTFRALEPGPRQAVILVQSNALKNPHRAFLAGFGRDAPPPDPEPKRCADFVADGVSFDVINRNRAGADLLIVGRARNMGPAVFEESGTLDLYEGEKFVQGAKIFKVGVKNDVSVTYKRSWKSSGEGKFPQYRLVVNVPSDCNPKDNVAYLNGGDIDKVLGAGGVVIPVEPDRQQPAPKPEITEFYALQKPGIPFQLCYSVKGAVRVNIEPKVGVFVAPKDCVRAQTGIAEFVLYATNADGIVATRGVKVSTKPIPGLQQKVPDRIARE